MTVRKFSNTATEATLTGSISAADATINVTSYDGYPDPPFTAAIDRGTVDEEVVLVTAVSSGVVTATRGYDGTTAKSHSAGASFLHVTVAKDYDEANAHVNASTGVHGVSGGLVGTTDVQTLSNKTLNAPAIVGGTHTGSTSFTGASFTGAVSFASTVTLVSFTAASGAVTGDLDVGGSLDVSGDLTAAGALSGASANVTGNSTVGGNHTVTGVGRASRVIVAEQANPGAAPAGTVMFWATTDGRLFANDDAGAAMRFNSYHIVSVWSPIAANHLEGDLAGHVTTGERRILSNGAWRAFETRNVANAAARTAIAAGDKYENYRVRESDTERTYEWDGTYWRLQGPPQIIQRKTTPSVTAAVIETGAGGVPALASFTTTSPMRAKVECIFRTDVGTATAALMYGRINGANVTEEGVARTDVTTTTIGYVDLAAATHTPSLRAEGYLGGTVGLASATMIITLGAVE